MATLNSIADEITGALDRPFDAMFKERVKELFKHQLSLLLRQEINKRGVNDLFATSFTTNIIDVTDSNKVNLKYLSGIASDYVYRSESKVPIPIRYNTDDPFTYVGDKSGSVPYVYSKLGEIVYAGLLNINKEKQSRYTYQNQYLYLYNTNVVHIDVATTLLAISGVYPIGDVMSDEDTLNGITFQDDTTLIFPDDLIQQAKLWLMKGELTITDEKDKVKPTNIDNL